MITRLFSSKALGALAGVALLAQSAGSASAFTLSSPSLEPTFAGAQVDKVYWCRWGRCGYGWGYHPGWGYRPGWGRHCWMSPWGWRCRYW
ncbi:MAG TPA: hypothetical protein VKS78_16280 [Roseiarcus sp.]|nr:hypothetical protein [Roseiarcus sp.]